MKNEVKYILFIDRVREEEEFEKFADAQFAGRNCSCMEHAIFRQVNGVLGKCLERMSELD